MLKSVKQLIKLGIGPYVLVLKIVKVPDNYYTIYSNFLSVSFRMDYLQPNLLHSLKTFSHNNVIKVCSPVVMKFDTTYNRPHVLKKYDIFCNAKCYSIKRTVWLQFSVHYFQ